MFENYQNLSTQYTPNNYTIKNTGNENLSTVSPNKPFEVLNAQGELIGYFWYYGNTVVLSFDISGEYVSGSDSYIEAEDVLKDLKLTLTIYDSRHNIKYQKSDGEDDTVIRDGAMVDFIIDRETSEKLLKGKYSVQLVASNAFYHETIFGTDTCIFEVR